MSSNPPPPASLSREQMVGHAYTLASECGCVCGAAETMVSGLESSKLSTVRHVPQGDSPVKFLPLCLILLLPIPAVAQIKPTGTFAIDRCDARPAWSSFAMLAEWANFDEAAACARTTGIRWVLALYASSRYTPAREWAPAVKARADAAGLTPYLVALVWHEEWYEYAFTPGALPIPGLDPTNPAHTEAIVRTVHWWVGEQHAALATIFPGVARVWLTGLYNDDPRFGPALWRPVPAHTSVIALELYQPCGWTWAQTGGRYTQHALATSPLPLVLIAHGFLAPGDPLWGCGPSDEAVAGFAEALRHPKTWGAWIFTWGDRWNMQGLASLHSWRSKYEKALGLH